MRRKLAISLGAIALLAFLLAGCGGDDDSTSSGGTGATGATGAADAEATTESESASSDSTEEASSDKARFIKEADKICEEADRKQLAALKKEAEKLKKNRSKAEERKLVLNAGLPAIREQVDELEELDPPSGEEEEVEALIAAMDKAVREIEENPDVLSKPGASPAPEVNRTSADYGFEACADLL